MSPNLKRYEIFNSSLESLISQREQNSKHSKMQGVYPLNISQWTEQMDWNNYRIYQNLGLNKQKQSQLTLI